MSRIAYTILDGRSRRMVLPRSTSAEAIDTMTRAFVGRGASVEQRAECWARLRDEEGYRLTTAAPLPSRVPRVRTNA